MKRLLIILCLGWLGFMSCKQPKEYTSFVDVKIGTTRGGNQVPGPHMPFGLMELSPVTLPEDKHSPSIYRADDKECYGFSIVNIVGSGCTTYGSVLISPQAGKPDMNNKKSLFANEQAKVGYYKADLTDHKITAEMTSALRSAVLRFTLPKGQSTILFDMSRINTEDTAFMLNWVSDYELEGSRTDGQFCGKPGVHTLYFYVLLKTKPSEKGLLKNNVVISETSLTVKRDKTAAFATYDAPSENHVVDVQVAVSYVSTANAKLNLEREIGGKSFAEVQYDCLDAWNKMLSRVEVEGGTNEDKIKFYTAIYHTMSHPNIMNDINGEYPAMETMKTMRVNGRDRFTLYSLWDTYRTLHPFFTLAYPEVQSQMVQSMLDMYKDYGWLPHWECISREKGVMNGDPSLIVINDSWQKGIRDFNADTALEAMIHNTREVYTANEADRKGVQYIRKGKDVYLQHNGFIPQDYKDAGNDVWGVVATTEEYNLADWNLAQLAKSLGRDDIYQTYSKLSEGYKFFFDSTTKFFRRRYADGHWASFNPFDHSGEMPWAYSGGPGYTEGHAWHYRFFIPHDIKNVIQLMGGPKAFVDTLQACFDKNYYMPDNEPDIAYPFLFNYVKGEEWRTQKAVWQILNKEFRLGPDGIPGNDDTGTMSAWLIFAMMGIYPDCPGALDYQISSPAFDRITIHLNDTYYKGHKFVIETKNNSKDNKYIQSMQLNGSAYDKYTINHNDIIKGGKLEIVLGAEPKK